MEDFIIISLRNIAAVVDHRVLRVKCTRIYLDLSNCIPCLLLHSSASYNKFISLRALYPSDSPSIPWIIPSINPRFIVSRVAIEPSRVELKVRLEYFETSHKSPRLVCGSARLEGYKVTHSAHLRFILYCRFLRYGDAMHKWLIKNTEYIDCT
jgi:hypothetical protein